MPHVSVVEATGAPWAPKGLTSANTRAGARPLCTTRHEATLPAAPTAVTVGGEATGPEGLRLSEARIAQGYRVLVLTPFDVKARRGTTRRGTTTDPVDARLIAELRQREHVPSSPGPEATGQGLRALTRWRADLVAPMGDVTRRVISILDRTFPEVATYGRDGWGQAARTVSETWTLPDQLAAVPTARLARLSHGHFGAEKARAVKEAAPQRSGVRRAADALAFARRLLWRQIRALERLVAELDRGIQRRDAGVDQ